MKPSDCVSCCIRGQSTPLPHNPFSNKSSTFLLIHLLLCNLEEVNPNPAAPHHKTSQSLQPWLGGEGSHTARAASVKLPSRSLGANNHILARRYRAIVVGGRAKLCDAAGDGDSHVERLERCEVADRVVHSKNPKPVAEGAASGRELVVKEGSVEGNRGDLDVGEDIELDVCDGHGRAVDKVSVLAEVIPVKINLTSGVRHERNVKYKGGGGSRVGVEGVTHTVGGLVEVVTAAASVRGRGRAGASETKRAAAELGLAAVEGVLAVGSAGVVEEPLGRAGLGDASSKDNSELGGPGRVKVSDEPVDVVDVEPLCIAGGLGDVEGENAALDRHLADVNVGV